MWLAAFWKGGNIIPLAVPLHAAAGFQIGDEAQGPVYNTPTSPLPSHLIRTVPITRPRQPRPKVDAPNKPKVGRLPWGEPTPVPQLDPPMFLDAPNAMDSLPTSVCLHPDP